MSSNTQETQEVFDAIVIGGGPAGATCASRMAAQGHTVLLVEKTQFPRFHIGESLVPYLTQAFHMMGLLEQIEHGPFVHKYGVELALQDNSVRRVEFINVAPGQRPLAFNTDRAALDHVLLEACTRAGGQVRTQAEVQGVLFDGERIAGITYTQGGQNHVARARVVVDASGRAGLIAKQFRLRKMNPRLHNVAIFQQFRNLIKENNPSPEGDLVLSSHPEGWLWGIPLGPDALSLGAVMPAAVLKGRNPQAVFTEHLSRAPRLLQRVQGARPVFEPIKVESDYCYHAERLAGPGYFIVGDAGCFVDPVFSGGVYLSVVCGMKAAEVIDEILRGGDETKARTYFENFCKTGYDSYFRLVYAFYESCANDIGRILYFFSPGNFPFFLQTMCGDFWGRPDQPVLHFLRARPEWATFAEPFELIYECPIYPETCYTVENMAMPH